MPLFGLYIVNTMNMCYLRWLIISWLMLMYVVGKNIKPTNPTHSVVTYSEQASANYSVTDLVMNALVLDNPYQYPPYPYPYPHPYSYLPKFSNLHWFENKTTIAKLRREKTPPPRWILKLGWNRQPNLSIRRNPTNIQKHNRRHLHRLIFTFKNNTRII